MCYKVMNVRLLVLSLSLLVIIVPPPQLMEHADYGMSEKGHVLKLLQVTLMKYWIFVLIILELNWLQPVLMGQQRFIMYHKLNAC